MRHAIAVFCVALAGACGSTEPADAFKGSYDLATVNGQPLPFRTTLGAFVTTLDRGSLIVSPDGRFSLLSSGTQTVAGEAPSSMFSQILSGTWHAEGNTLTLSSDNTLFDLPPVLTATYARGTMTYTGGGNTYVYRRD
jgi:hypothetical protein